MAKYRKKPVIIEAIKFTGNNSFEIENWSKNKVYSSPVLEPSEGNPTGHYLQIETLEGVMTAVVGDWIIKGHSDKHGIHYWAVKDDYFKKAYEPA